METIIKKGTKLEVRHSRKGRFEAFAEKDFKTSDEWYPLILASESVDGMMTKAKWEEGEEIPCRASLCLIKIL